MDEKEILKAAQSGDIEAQRHLGVCYATGDWTGPKDLAEAARWYRLAAEQGHSESQYDLGFMLLLGEGGPKNIEEGLQWLERAAEQNNWSAFRLLRDCYENGYCDVPVDAAKARLWRERLEEHERLHPPKPIRRYQREISQSDLDALLDIDGVVAAGFISPDQKNEFFVAYDSAVIAAEDLDNLVDAALPS